MACAFGLVSTACAPRGDDGAVTVLAAASLTDALEAVGAAFTEQTGTEVRFAFASSSTVARQIEAGAPAHAVALASEEWMDYLSERGLVREGSRVSPVGNALVLIAPTDAGVAAVEIGSALDLLSLLGPEGRLSVGDPAHVPAGQYAREALATLGLWSVAEARLAPALDVRGALALVERGEAPLGIVYATDAAISDRVKVVGVFPESSHASISYPFGLLADGAGPEAEAFLAFATGDAGLSIFERHGFARRGAR